MERFRTRQPSLWDDIPWHEIGLPPQVADAPEEASPEAEIVIAEVDASADKPKNADWS